MKQMSIFDVIYSQKKIEKPIRLIELFAGYGSQALALKYLGVNFEHHKIVEWAVKSIEAYNDIHFGDHTNYSKDLTDEEIFEYLVDKGISMDYNKPMSRDQIKRKSIEWQRKVYNDIIATHNLVDISRVHAQDLEINEQYENIMTYSFPCQDLSLAGLGKGMSRDSGTRSGLLWQVERILLECKELGTMPQILLMENVPEVCGENNKESFVDWCSQLTKLGYHNTMAILNAKDYGIPQNRRRCFMVSIYGEYAYSMPEPMKLKYRLKDFLESDVATRFYLDDNLIKHIQKTSKESKNYTGYDRYNGALEHICRVWKNTSPTLHSKSNQIKIYINSFLIEKQNIRNLTPTECFRLMGVKDTDGNKVKQTDASKYHLTGDSIVTTCLMGLFGELLGIDYKNKIQKLVEELIQK